MKKLGSFLLGFFIAATSVVLGQVPINGLPEAHIPLTGNETVVMNQANTGCPVGGCTVQAPVSSFAIGVNDLTAGTGITLTPNPILSSGVISLTNPVPTVAAPSATIGLTPIDGSTGNFMDAGSAPALSQSISPTMIGNWNFTPSSGIGLTATAVANSFAAKLIGTTGTGTSDGLDLQAGTNASDTTLLIQNAAASQSYLKMFGDGGIVLNGATGGDKGPGTMNTTQTYINGIAVGTGSGSVTSVGMTVPTCFSITGTPVTTSGVLALGMTGATTTVLQGDGTCIAKSSLVAVPGGSTTQMQYNNAGVFAGSTMDFNNSSSSYTIPTAGGGIPTLAIGTTEPVAFYDSANLPAAHAGNINFIGGAATPVAGRIMWGDGSGWNMYFSKRSASATTDMIEFTDTGNMYLNATGNDIVAGCPFTTGNAFVTTQIQVCNPGGDAFFTTWDSTNAIAGLFGSDTNAIDIGSFSNHGVNIRTNNTNRIVLSSGGNGTFTFGTMQINSSTVNIVGSTNTSATVSSSGGNSTLILDNNGTGEGELCLNTVSSGAECVVGDLPNDTSVRVNTGQKFHIGDFGGNPFFDIGFSVATFHNQNVTLNQPSSGTALTVSGAANANTLVLSASTTTNQSFGLSLGAGTSSSDYNTSWRNAAGSVIGQLWGDGGMTLGSPTGSDMGLGTINVTGCFVNGVACASGSTQTTTTASIGTSGVCTTGVTAGNMRFVKTGNTVTASWSGTQMLCAVASAVNTISFASTIPSGYIPTNTNGCVEEFTTSTAGYPVQANFTSAGAVSISVFLGGTNQTTWDSAGGSCTYVLN